MNRPSRRFSVLLASVGTELAMNIQCDVRLEYTANGRSGHRWREGAELSISKDGMSVAFGQPLSLRVMLSLTVLH